MMEKGLDLDMSAEPHAAIRLADVHFSDKEQTVEVAFEMFESAELLVESQVLLKLTRSIDYGQGARPSYELAVQTAAVQLGAEFIEMAQALHKIAEAHSSNK